MWPSNLSPDNSNLGSSNFLLRTVDESNLLSEVEVCGLGIRDTLDLDQAGARCGVTLATLVAQMATFDIQAVTSF